MSSGKNKETRSSSKDRSYDEEDKSSRKKSAKDRKRELESMYGSQPLPPTPARPESNRMASSLPTDMDNYQESPEGKKNKSKHSKKNKAAAVMEQSFAVHELIQSRPNMTRGTSKNMPQRMEQSFAVDELVEQRGRSKSPRPSKGEKMQARSLHGRSNHLQRANSGRPQMARGRSTSRSGMLNSQHSSRPVIERSSSQTARTRSLSRASSSHRGRSLGRSGSGIGSGEGSTRRGLRPGLSTKLSRPTLKSQFSSRPALNAQMSRSRSMSRSRHGNMSGSILYDGHATVVIAPGSSRPLVNTGRGGRNIRRFLPGKEIEEKPSRSIVLVWLIITAELGFDLGTTIIAFQSFLDEDSCCGRPINLGSIPISSTIPFFLLVVAELAFLIRAISLTLWPSMMAGGDDDTEPDDLEDPSRRRKRSTFMRYCCCFFRWKIQVLLKVVNFLVLLNPFFGCIIAWILMYQSDKTEAFIVLGLEGASLILHFVSVWLEGSFHTCKEIAFHCIPLIPFFISIGLVAYYLKQGGVCYLVEENVFKFTGCEVCNISGVLEPCPNGTNLFDEFGDLDTFDKIKDKVLERTNQATYCSAERSFCFYNYDDGQVPPVNGLDSTNYPSEFKFTEAITTAPTPSPEDIDVSTPTDEIPDNEDQEIAVAPTEPPQTDVPTVAPIPPTRAPTDPPTSAQTSEPTPDTTPDTTPEPVEEQQPDSSPNGGGGSDGFNMDEIGSDGFDPNDLLG